MFLVRRLKSGVPVLVHWSVPALSIFMLGAGAEHIVTTTAAVASYLLILLIHEIGHQSVAQRLRYQVRAIKIYPIHGNCTYEAPDSRYHESLIAWGGPAAQFVVAAPLTAYVAVHGPTQIEPVNAILAILGFFSPVVALFNLLPIKPLDGRKAWSLIPIVWRRIARRQRPPATAMEAMEEALRKARKRHGS